jgi:hypothetical protein
MEYINRNAFDLYHMTVKREETLWNDCVFVFDTSALLDFYFYPETTRDEIYADILEKIKDRLWIPNHVQFEYFKNREEIILKPIGEHYNPLKDSLLSISNHLDETKKRLQELKQKTKNKGKHPFIDSSKIDEFEQHLGMYAEKVKDFDEKYQIQIQEKIKEIQDLKKDDTVLNNFETYFLVGRKYSFDEILQIVKEGKLRYEFDIPPGYEDLKKEKKEGTQIFGDLIIWKQILEYAKEQNKNIVFICNDLKKDWCTLENSTEKRIKSPREELIKEFNDYTGKEFWMYNQAQFIYTSNILLKSNIAEKSIEQISQFITQKAHNSKNNFLVYKCDNCNKTHQVDIECFDLEYDCVDSSERQMGEENQYEAMYEFECPTCDNKIMGTFSIWEYPVGVINYTEVVLDGATVISACRLDIDLYAESNYEEYDDDEYFPNLSDQFLDNEQ